MSTDVPKKTREEVYVRDGFRCRWCGQTNTIIDIHHIVYRSSGVDHSPGNLICLCRRHHNLVHTNKRLYQPVLVELMQLPGATGIQLMRWQGGVKTPVSRIGARVSSGRPD